MKECPACDPKSSLQAKTPVAPEPVSALEAKLAESAQAVEAAVPVVEASALPSPVETEAAPVVEAPVTATPVETKDPLPIVDTPAPEPEIMAAAMITSEAPHVEAPGVPSPVEAKDEPLTLESTVPVSQVVAEAAVPPVETPAEAPPVQAFAMRSPVQSEEPASAAETSAAARQVEAADAPPLVEAVAVPSPVEEPSPVVETSAAPPVEAVDAPPLVEAVAAASPAEESSPAKETSVAVPSVEADAPAPPVEAVAAPSPLDTVDAVPPVDAAALVEATQVPVETVPPALPVEAAQTTPIPEAEPDPLLALAEQIRSAHMRQAGKITGDPQPKPVESGLAHLAAAVGTVEPPPAAAIEPVATPAAPVIRHPLALSPGTQAVALLAPPEVAVATPAVTEPAAPLPSAVALAPNIAETPVLENQPQPELQPAPQTAAADQPAEADGPKKDLPAEVESQPLAQAIETPVSQPEFIHTEAASEIPPLPESTLTELEKPQPAAPAPEAQAAAPAIDAVHPPVVKELAPEPPALDNPPSGSRLQLAPFQEYASTASTAVRPAAPPQQILMPDSGPRMTLPGPTLPPELVSLKSANVVTVIGAGNKPRLPGWLISALLMLGIPIAGGLILLYFQPLQHSSADAPAAAEVQAPAAVAATENTHSLAQYVEVTGFRIVVDFNKKSEIHYLVVNHSAADLSGMTLFVTLRNSNAKPGQPPVCRFSFRAPGLGPFESKEMSSPIEKISRSVTLPEWQDLKSEVQIAQ